MTGYRGAARVDMFHHRAGRGVEELHDVQRIGDVFEIGLGESVLAALERLHVHDRASSVHGSIKRRGLVGVRAVTQVIRFYVFASADHDFRREIADIPGKIGISG